MNLPCYAVYTICSQPPCRILLSIYYIWRCSRISIYSELTKTSTALPRLAVLSVLSAAHHLVLIFVNSL